MARSSMPVARPRERAVLVALDRGDGGATVEQNLEELAGLCTTAGLEVVAQISQARRVPDVATFVGRGKVDEIRGEIEEREAQVVVFDDPLSPAQTRNLERRLGMGPGNTPFVSVLDRAQLILDIFAQRARTIEGKLQVELAQLEYLLPRLTGHWTHLSRQRGGAVGTRGPGETQLEVDRRRIREKIAKLRLRLAEVRRTRTLHRHDRAAVPFPTVAFVGYTNAGKSSLMNALTGAGVPADSRLFATLDPTLRRLGLEKSGAVLLSDTVGFIHKLPHSLIDAFRSTLEEVTTADLLLHVTDFSDPEQEHHRAVVQEVLEEIGAAQSERIEVWNKSDRLADDIRAGLRLVAAREGAVLVSAHTREGLDQLLAAIDERLAPWRREECFAIPRSQAGLIGQLERGGTILSIEETDDGYSVTARLDPSLAGRIRKRLAEATAADAPPC